MVSTKEKKRVADREQRKYLKLNNLKLEECSDQDLENIRFNTEYVLLSLN